MNKLKIVSCEDRLEYQLNGQLHRANGPASLWDTGERFWYLFGKPHRYYGPSEWEDWQIHGKYVE